MFARPPGKKKTIEEKEKRFSFYLERRCASPAIFAVERSPAPQASRKRPVVMTQTNGDQDDRTLQDPKVAGRAVRPAGRLVATLVDVSGFMGPTRRWRWQGQDRRYSLSALRPREGIASIRSITTGLRPGCGSCFRIPFQHQRRFFRRRLHNDGGSVLGTPNLGKDDSRRRPTSLHRHGPKPRARGRRSNRGSSIVLPKMQQQAERLMLYSIRSCISASKPGGRWNNLRRLSRTLCGPGHVIGGGRWWLIFQAEPAKDQACFRHNWARLLKSHLRRSCSAPRPDKNTRQTAYCGPQAIELALFKTRPRSTRANRKYLGFSPKYFVDPKRRAKDPLIFDRRGRGRRVPPRLRGGFSLQPMNNRPTAEFERAALA